jgi:FMN phosphatase YigB (HAD superfamily)
MIRAVLFDLDDTLYEYAPCNEAALAAVHARLATGLDLPYAGFRHVHDDVRRELAIELAGQAASHDRRLFLERIVERLTGAAQPGLAGELHELYWSTFEQRMVPAPDAHAVLTALQASYRLAIVSNHVTAPSCARSSAWVSGPTSPPSSPASRPGPRSPTRASSGWRSRP